MYVSPGHPKAKKKRNWKAILKKNAFGWAIMIPTLLLFGFFVWVPLGKNIVMSFFSDANFTTFVGTKNYEILFQMDAFLASLGNTFQYILWSLLIGYLVPILLGFLLSEVVHAKGFFRVCLYLPCMISGIAVVFLFRNLYGDEPYSILNVILVLFGLPAQSWAGNVDLIIPLIVLAMTWRGAGSTALIYLSSFQQIDNSMYEAARIDGAGAWERFWRITIPSIKSTMLTLLILQIISVFQVFYETMVIGQWGGPVNSSMSLMLLSYKLAFADFNFPVSAACCVVLALIILTFTLIYQGVVKLLDRVSGGAKA